MSATTEVHPQGKLDKTSGTLWFWLTGVFALVLAAIPVLFNYRFYYHDDTQNAAYGEWVLLGRDLLHGSLPFLDPASWQGGNYVAEGWPIYNPFFWLVGIAANLMPSAVAMVTIVKVVLLVVGALGTFYLLRSFSIPSVWAFAIAIQFAAIGFTVYINAASWVVLLATSALLPWIWWAFRRTCFQAGSPAWPFLFGYLLITCGYVQGTMVLCFVILGVMVEGLVARRFASVRTVFVTGLILGLVALAVFWPMLATASVSVRQASVSNDNFLAPDINGALTSMMPFTEPYLTGFWGVPAKAPLLYLTWMLPLIALADFRKLGHLIKHSLSLIVVGGLVALLVFGPSAIGPLRFPARLFPELGLVLMGIVGLAVTSIRSRLGKPQLIAFFVTCSLGLWLSFADAPFAVKRLAVGFVVVALAGLGAAISRSRQVKPALTAIAAGLVTIIIVAAQHAWYPISPLADFGHPNDKSDYSVPLQGLQGTTLVVGTPYTIPDWWKETMLGNGVYVDNLGAINVYSTVGYLAITQTLHIDGHGWVNAAALDSLFTVDSTTHQRLVDLMTINNIQLITNGDAPESPCLGSTLGEGCGGPPAGWHIERHTDHTVIWTRDTPITTTGSVVYTGGATVTDVQMTATTVSFDVTSVDPSGGTVVFSRAAWPGYTVRGATLEDPVEGFLLTTSVSQPGHVEVRFAPPAYTLTLVALIGALVIMVGWIATRFVLTRRRRSNANPTALVAGHDRIDVVDDEKRSTPSGIIGAPEILGDNPQTDIGDTEADQQQDHD